MRRIGAGLVCVVLSAGLLAGCGSNVRPPEPRPSGGPRPSTSAPPSTAAPTPAPPTPTAPAPTMPPGTVPPSTGPVKAPKRRFYHRLPGQSYRFENSLRGVEFAASRGYAWMDIDTNYTMGRRPDGSPGAVVPIATHWPTIDMEGFDPRGRYPRGTRWSDLTWEQARALRTAERPPFRVLRIETMVRAAAEAGLTGIEWEVKTGKAFEDPAFYTPVLDLARRLGIAIEVKTLYRLGGREASFARLRAAKAAGATTMLIREPGTRVRIPVGELPYIDLVRARWRVTPD